ncbi:MAG: DUF3054 domain-containing protein [Chloroflexota bacterium]|nr:DUF3054 domain-containing protein [Chloroflexota bacterium]
MADTVTSPQVSSAPAWRLPLLIVGDALCFLLFAGLGRDTHGEATGLGALGQVALTALPFALAWFIVSPWLGVYRRAATNTIRRMLTRTWLAWACAYPVALGLRVLLAPDHKMPITFAIVILLANAVILGLWRLAVALGEWLLARRAAA